MVVPWLPAKAAGTAITVIGEAGANQRTPLGLRALEGTESRCALALPEVRTNNHSVAQTPGHLNVFKTCNVGGETLTVKPWVKCAYCLFLVSVLDVVITV